MDLDFNRIKPHYLDIVKLLTCYMEELGYEVKSLGHNGVIDFESGHSLLAYAPGENDSLEWEVLVHKSFKEIKGFCVSDPRFFDDLAKYLEQHP